MARTPALILAAAIALLLMAGAGPAAAMHSGPPTVVSAECHGHNFKPSRIILACGDAGLVAEHLKWASWGRREAKGSGTGTAETCDPNCATGGRRSGPMEVRLFRTARCSRDGRVHFTRIEYRWANGAPIAGQPDRGVVPSPCSAV
ncbi:MAG TPA: hypothetical protein VH476_11755 [Solirubrobacterales bacterium]